MVQERLGSVLGELNRILVVAATDPVARRLEALHAELEQGPCLHAARTGERVVLGDLGGPDATERFPRFADRALAAGVAAVYSFPLRTADQRVGSLSLCSDLPADFDEADLELAQLLVDLAARSYQHRTAARRRASPGRRGRAGAGQGTAQRAARDYPRGGARAPATCRGPHGMPLAAVAEQVATGVLRLPPTTDVDLSADP
jgi:GAF domain-containing protein